MPKVPDIALLEWQPDRIGAAHPFVSIIVPALNEEENLEAALSSLLRLDYSNYEVIAVYRSLTDRTGDDDLAWLRFRRAGKGCESIMSSSYPKVAGETQRVAARLRLAKGEWLLLPMPT